MKWIIVIAVVGLGFYSSCLYSQQGFNESYDLGGRAAGFGSLEVSGDTVVIFGVLLPQEQPAGMLFARIDTFGNVIDFRVHQHSEGDAFTIVRPRSFIKLSDNSGYAGVGSYFFSENGIFCRFDHSGNVLAFKEHDETITSNNNYRQIIEVHDGFLIGGNDFQFTTSIEIFIIKIDFEGNIQWKKRYGSNNREDLFGSLLKINDNEFVVGSTTTSVQGVPLPQVRNTSKIFAIDSLGNVKWEWESPLGLEEAGVGDVFKTNEGHWAYMSGRLQYNATINVINKQPKFVLRDENFNLVKEDTFGMADHTANGFFKTIQMNDGGLLAIGVKPHYYAVEPAQTTYNSLSGWMLRLDSEYNTLWSRADTAFWSNEMGSENYLYDAVELPGGSIIACGYSTTYEPQIKDWAWLIKVDKDGCLDTLFCAPVNSVSFQEPGANLKIYPNPTHSIINIETDHGGAWDRIVLYNAAGQVINTLTGGINTQLDISDLPDGMYFIQLTKKGHSTTRKIVKRR
ncbi:MAG: T9SS type A sorting domain-containing protein [Saprospiraceae bacterium]